MNLFALLLLGLLTGNELSVGAFVNPSLARLEAREHAAGAQAMARVFGRVMPFWMAATLALLGASTWRAKKKTVWAASTALMALVIVWSLVMPVPINNRVSRWELDNLPDGWRDELQTFGSFHNVRVAALLCSFVLALRGASQGS